MTAPRPMSLWKPHADRVLPKDRRIVEIMGECKRRSGQSDQSVIHLNPAPRDPCRISPRHANDAHHIALATVALADLVVSWNFKHIVHWDRIRLFNAVNLREGYSPIDIRSPREVVS